MSKTFVYQGFWSCEVEADNREQADEIFEGIDESCYDHNYWNAEVVEIDEEE